MRLGMILLPGSDWTSDTRRVADYERAGFAVIATGDHMRHPLDTTFELLDGWSVLPAWAATTDRVRLSMLVTNVIYRSPMLLARQATAVDHISGGRLEVGIGTGLFESDHAMAGIPAWSTSERIARTEEFILAYDAMISGKTAFEGRWYSFTDSALVPLPLQRPRPPLIVGANGPKTIDLAARLADGWNTWGGYGIDETRFFELAAKRIGIYKDRCAHHGRDPSRLLRSILVHHGAVDPWQSPSKFVDVMGRCGDLGFDDLVFYEPKLERRAAFERVVTEILPELASAP